MTLWTKIEHTHTNTLPLCPVKWATSEWVTSFWTYRNPPTNTPFAHEGSKTNLKTPEPESSYREGGECECCGAVQGREKMWGVCSSVASRWNCTSQDELRTVAPLAACSGGTDVPCTHERIHTETDGAAKSEKSLFDIQENSDSLSKFQNRFLPR
jgi:hypothetical protein